MCVCSFACDLSCTYSGWASPVTSLTCCSQDFPNNVHQIYILFASIRINYTCLHVVIFTRCMSIATENRAIAGQHEMAFINEQHRIQQRLYSMSLFTVTFMRHTDELAPYHPLHRDLQRPELLPLSCLAILSRTPLPWFEAFSQKAASFSRRFWWDAKQSLVMFPRA